MLDLKSVDEIIQLALPNHSFCIRLEPRSTAKSRPWTLACSSQADLETWICALQKRLVRSPANTRSPGPSPVENLKKRRPTNSWFNQPTSSFLHSNDTDDNDISFFGDSINNDNNKIQQQQYNNYYHAITPSTVVQPRIRKTNKNQPPPSLSRRRGIYLEPLMLSSSPFDHATKDKNDTDYYVHALSSFASTPTSCSDVLLSSSSLLSLATTAVDTEASADNGKLVPVSSLLLPSIIDSYEDEENLDRGRSMSAPDIFQKNKNKHALADGETSPTFLLYKERFHLC